MPVGPALSRTARSGRPRTARPPRWAETTQPTNMISENVHRPRQAPIPTVHRSSRRAQAAARGESRSSTQNESSHKRREVGQKVDHPGMPGQPRHVGRLVLKIAERQPHRLPVPPGALPAASRCRQKNRRCTCALESAEEQRPRHARWGPRVGRRAASASQRSSESAGPAGADGQVKSEDDVDLIQAEQSFWNAIDERNHDQERQERRDARPQTRR